MLCCSQFPLLLRPFVFPGEPTEAYSEEGGGRLFYGGLAALVAPQRWGQASWGQGQATSFCNKLNSLKADPSLFPPRSLPDRSRPERRCKNKRDVWISPHKRLTTHARRVALFCLYLGILEVSCHLKEASGRASDGILGYWEADEWSDRWTIRM